MAAGSRRRQSREKDRGRAAAVPSEIPLRGWRDILWRVWHETNEDRITLIAAGVTYYLLLALFPALAAFVSLYGFVANPVTVADHVALLAGLLPRDGLDIIRSQLQSLASADHGALTFGFVTALAIAFWSANNGIKSLFEALNIAYEEREKRSFLRLNLMAFAFTLGAMVIATGLIVSVGVVPAILALLHLDAFSAAILAVARWPIILVLTAIGISILYRFGPSRRYAQWRWISWGSALATIIWIAASAGFSFYLQNFANYNATYGSLGAVIGLMLWTWISVVVLLVGAELNAEMEHQTAMDTTTGRPRPMGKRGAVVADTLGRVPPESED